VEQLSGLPSWCPNFAYPENTISLGGRVIDHPEAGLGPTNSIDHMYHAGFTLSGKWKLPERSFAALREIIYLLRHDQRHDDHHYDTNNPCQLSVIPNTEYLCAHGIHIDEVIAYVECNPDLDNGNPISHNNLKKTMNWLNSCFSLASQKLKSEHPGLVYAKTLVADRTSKETWYWSQVVGTDKEYGYQFYALEGF
jgi:hypothetical protein